MARKSIIIDTSEYWLNFSEGLLDGQFDELKALVFEKLDAIVKSSSRVAMVNALIRPYLNSSKGQITAHSALRADFGPIHPGLRDQLAARLRHTCPV